MFGNLLIVAVLGLLMRSSFLIDLGLNYRYIQHSHSHFAFAGWVTQSLFFLIYTLIHKRVPVQKNDWRLYYIHLFVAYGMLISFAFQGYGAVSIVFSTLSVFINLAIVIRIIRLVHKIDLANKLLLKGGLFFSSFSALGTFYLAYLMASGQNNSPFYPASIYFYLHFQYNGWFVLGGITVISNYLNIRSDQFSTCNEWLLLLTVALTYPLSLLSLLESGVLIWSGFVISLIQLYCVVRIISPIIGHFQSINGLRIQRLLLIFVVVALMIKVVLQLLSTLPAFHELAFSNHPVLIAYLHLVFLLFTTNALLFAFTRLFSQATKPLFTIGILLLLTGMILNEIVLVMQGLGMEKLRAHNSILLLIFAIMLVVGSFILLLFVINTRKLDRLKDATPRKK